MSHISVDDDERSLETSVNLGTTPVPDVFSRGQFYGNNRSNRGSGLDGFSISRQRDLSYFLPPNNKKPDAIVLIKDCFLAGLGIRETARKLGFARQTIRSYYRKFVAIQKEPGRCACGEIAGHQGWCGTRFAKSEKRQAFMREWKSKAGKHSPIKSGLIIQIKANGELHEMRVVEIESGDRVILMSAKNRSKGRWWLPMDYVMKYGTIPLSQFPQTAPEAPQPTPEAKP